MSEPAGPESTAPAGGREEAPCVLYIAGAGRSGSTLLEQLVTQRGSAFATGELCYLWRRGVGYNERCSCGHPFHDCPFWQGVLAEAFGSPDVVPAAELQEHQDFLLRMRHIPLLRTGRGQSAEFLERRAALSEAYLAVYRSIQRATGARYLIDSSKFASFGYLVAAVPELDVRVIHLVRDSRAVAHSWQRRKERPEATEANRFMPVFSARQSATIWLQDNFFSGGLRRHVERGALLRYEDMVARPDLIDRTLAAVGVTAEQRPATVDDQLARHSVSGNPSRLDTSPPRVSLDAAWTQQMDRRSVATVTAMTAAGLARYGYPLRPGAGPGRPG